MSITFRHRLSVGGSRFSDQRIGARPLQISRSKWRVYAEDDLKVSKKELGDSRIELTLTVSSEATQKYYDNYIKRLRHTVQVPGYRKGSNVPLPLLISFRGGEKEFKGGLLQTLITQSVDKALREWQSVVIQDSDRVESNVEELIETFEPDKELVFSVSFDVLSEVRWKSPYQEIQIDVEGIGDESTDAERVEKSLRIFRKENGMQRIVADRGLEVGDIAIMDFDFVRPDNRESLPQLKQEKFRFDTDLPDGLGVMKHLTGIRVGDVRECPIRFPDDWEPAIYRGLDTLAIVKCHELFSWDLPELTDDLVKSLNRPSLQTVDDLRSSLLMAEAQRRAERMKDIVQEALRDKLASIVDYPVSETALMETAKYKYHTMLLEMQAKGQLSPESMEELTTEKFLHNYVLVHRAELLTIQKGLAAMEAVSKELVLPISSEELTAEVAQAQAEFEARGEEFNIERLQEMATEILQNAKVVEWFVKHGNINIIPYKQATSVQG